MAKTIRKPDVLDVQLMQVVPELLDTQNDSITIRDWIVSLMPFFMRARALEVAAKATLAKAELLVEPKNGDEDTRMQAFIKTASADTKIVEEHWKITSLVYTFQRRLVAVRKRATDPLEQAAKIAQQHHNQYVAAENRRVEEENERRRQKAAADEQARRDAELAELEKQALKLESQSLELSEREKLFVDYVTGPYRDPARAAQQAGFKDPKAQGARLMASPKIQKAMRARLEADALRQQAEAKKAAPVSRGSYVAVKADVGGGGVDRTTKSMEIFDERLLVEAVIGGRHGIPADILQANQVKANDYARNLGDVVNRWPGCRLKTKTGTV